MFLLEIPYCFQTFERYCTISFFYLLPPCNLLCVRISVRNILTYKVVASLLAPFMNNNNNFKGFITILLSRCFFKTYHPCDKN